MARHENPDLDPDKVPLTWIGLTTLQLRLLVAIAGGSPDELLQAWHARRPSGTEAPDPVSDISAAGARGAPRTPPEAAPRAPPLGVQRRRRSCRSRLWGWLNRAKVDP